MDVAFSFAPCLKQCLDGGAFVDLASDQLPPFLLAVTGRVIRKLWCAEQCIEIVRYGGWTQGGFSR